MSPIRTLSAGHYRITAKSAIIELFFQLLHPSEQRHGDLGSSTGPEHDLLSLAGDVYNVHVQRIKPYCNCFSLDSEAYLGETVYCLSFSAYIPYGGIFS